MSTITNIRRAPRATAHALQTPVLCLHCSGSSGRQWQAYPQLLPTAQVIAPDLLGSGAQGHWLGEHEVRLVDEVAALESVLDRVGMPVQLVGHSYGGAVALAMAMRWPDRVAGLYLFEPVRFALLNNAADRSAWEEITGVGQAIAAFARSGHLHASAEIFVDYWSGTGTWAALPPERRNAVAARMPKVRNEFGALFSDETPPSEYAHLQMPVHLFHGSTSPWPARRVVDLLAAACGGASVTCLQGASHMGPIEEPARFVAQIAPLFGAMDAEAWSVKAA